MSFMEPLLALQDIDDQIYELEQEIKDIPLRKEAEMEKLEMAKSSLAAAQDDLRAAKSEADSLALQAQATQDYAEKLKDHQSGLKSAKSLTALDAQIANSKTQQEKLEAEHLSALEALPDAERRVTDAQAQMTAEAEDIERYIGELDERLEEAKVRLAELQVQREEAAQKVQKDTPQHLVIYNRLRKSRRPTIVPLHDGVCGGCHLTQPPAVAHLVHRMNAPGAKPGDKRIGLVTCQMCGRLLYEE